MNRVKINTGMAAIVLLGSFVAGWQTLLIVVALMLLFCEITDTIKNIMINIIVFLLAITLFDIVWTLITNGVGLITGSFDKIIGIINNYLSEPITTYKLNMYLLEPINSVMSLADGIVDYLIYFAKFAFIISILTNKPMKENFVVKKINDFVNKAIIYINSFEVNIYANQQVAYSNLQNVNPGVSNAMQQPVQMPQQAVPTQQQTVPQQNINQ